MLVADMVVVIRDMPSLVVYVDVVVVVTRTDGEPTTEVTVP